MLSIFILLSILGFWNQYSSKFEKSIPIPHNARINIENIAGDIEIQTSEERILEIEAQKSVRASSREKGMSLLEKVILSVSKKGKRIDIRTLFPRSFNGWVDYTIITPSDVSISVNTSSGDISISNIDGKLSLKTASGDIKLENINKAISTETASGNITIKNTIPPEGDFNIETTSGDIMLKLPSSSQFRLEAKAISGDIDIDFPVETEKARKGKIYGRIGTGGPLLKLSTTSGDIRIKSSGKEKLKKETKKANFHEKIELGREKMGEVEIELGSSHVVIEKGKSKNLIEADIDYNPNEFVPEMEQKRIGNSSRVRLFTKSKDKGVRIEDAFSGNRCKVYLTDRIPLDLNVRLGGFKGNIDLTDLKLNTFSLGTGAGSAELSFQHRNPIICKEMNIETGVSKFDGKRLGNARFKKLKFDGSVGVYTLDLRGEYKGRSDVEINIVTGVLSIILPKDIGIRLKPSGLLLKSINGLYEDKYGWWVSQNSGKTKGEIVLHINGALGTLNVNVEK